ncbi:UNVERIFIED_CONTAM: hypothetical protein HDU68_012925, partial [Siphonaria sp. JEL0065]
MEFVENPLDHVQTQSKAVQGGIQKKCDLWAYIWDSTWILTLLLDTADFQQRLRGSSVLEVGAGYGIASIAAVLLGATSVTATDFMPDAVECISRNAQRNGICADTLTTFVLDWHAATYPAALENAYDVILASD